MWFRDDWSFTRFMFENFGPIFSPIFTYQEIYEIHFIDDYYVSFSKKQKS